MEININKNIREISKNAAEQLFDFFNKNKIFCFNFLSSPGSGKTTILEKTLPLLKNKYNILVLEGDVETQYDTDRIRKIGIDSEQLNTNGACHLDAKMILKLINQNEDTVKKYDFIIIENVGNLICPGAFYLGEHKKGVVLSVTEGQEKPEKYPLMFIESELMIINKTDLLPYVDFNIEYAATKAKQLNNDLTILRTSAKTEDGIKALAEWFSKNIEIIKNK